MFEKIKSNVIAAIISAAIIGTALGIWEIVSDGGLVRALGGVTADELSEIKKELGTHPRKVACEAHPREDFSQQRTMNCEPGFKLAEWCSGDCNDDDAMVTLCCNYSQ